MNHELVVPTVDMPPRHESGFSAVVQWLMGSGYWLVTVDEPWHDQDGHFHLGEVWQVHYGLGEAENAYQALMLGLSEYRNRS